MIPAAFTYERPATLDAALAALAASGGSAKVIAGGQSLLPLMKLRLAHADTLIDIGRLAELKGARPRPTAGSRWARSRRTPRSSTRRRWRSRATACSTSATSRSATAAPSAARSPTATRRRMRRRSRSRSTTRRSSAPRAGERVIPLDEFFEGPFQTRLESDEILVSLRRGPLPAGADGAYRKLEQPASGYSIVGVAAVVASAGGAISHARVALTGVGDHPYRAKAVEAALLGSDGSPSAVAAAAAHATDGVAVNSDIHADRAYRSEMAVVYTRRAIEAALGRSA